MGLTKQDDVAESSPVLDRSERRCASALCPAVVDAIAGEVLLSDIDHRFRNAQWRMLLTTMFCYLFFYTGRQTFGFAIPGIQQELGISKATLGWASALMLWAYAVGQSINGNLGDKYGGRRLMSLAAFLSCGLNWAVSFGNSFTGLLAPWTINGYAQSMAWAPGSRVLSNWWPKRERGKVYGAYVFSAGMSSVLAFAASTLIVTSGLDWRWIFRLPVLLLLLGGVVYYAIIRDCPEDLGFKPLADEDEKSQQESDAPVEVEASRDRYLAVLSNPRFLFACLAMGFQNMARYGLLIWVPVHFLGEAMKGSTGTLWASLALPIGMAVGALTSGWLSDRVFQANRARVIGLFLTCAAVCSIGMYLLPQDPWLGMPLLLMTGFFAYGPQSALWALCPDLLGPKRAGTGTGVMNTFAYAFAGLGEPLIGRVIESYDNTSLMFGIVAFACMMGALVSLFIRR